MRGSVLLVLLLLWTQESVQSIRIVELRVPAHAAAGREALLGCQFDLEGDLLYSVKWYKDSKEFYRYMPRNPHQALRFNRPGVTVDMSRSSSDVVTLVHLKPESAGVYRCEVSGEKPHFATAADEKYITIQVLPKTGPRVTGLRYQYEVGDRLITNCSIPGSQPEAQLKWLVNGRTAPKTYLRGPWKTPDDDLPETFKTTIGLNFMVLPSHYKTGVMEIKCQATIAPLYQREKVYVLSKPEVTEEPADPELPLPDPGPPAASDEEIQEDLINSFRELANTLHLEAPAQVPSQVNLANDGITTTEESVKGYATSVEKSILVILSAILMQVVILQTMQIYIQSHSW